MKSGNGGCVKGSTQLTAPVIPAVVMANKHGMYVMYGIPLCPQFDKNTALYLLDVLCMLDVLYLVDVLYMLDVLCLLDLLYFLDPGGGGRGGTPRKIGWGCSARFPKLNPYPILFMTKICDIS